jgi:hypothetical protein
MNHGHAFQEFLLELQTALDNLQEDHKARILRKLVKLQTQREDATRRAKETGAVEAQAEAEAFAGMINKMLIDNELNPTDIDYARSNDSDPIIELRANLVQYGVKKSRVRVAWQASLARIVANAHLCTYLVQSSSNQIWFVGTKAHATVAEYVFGTLVPMAEKMSEQARRDFRNECRKACNYTKMDGFPEAYGFREAWLAAFIERISERFDEARKTAVAEAESRIETLPGSESVALMRLSGALTKVQKYIDDKFKSKRSGLNALSGRYRSNAAGSAAGRAAADKMTIGRRGVTGGSAKGLLGSGK